MDKHAFRTAESSEPIRYRIAVPRDSVAMWRMKRARGGDEALSPFFYVAVIQRLADACLVAEQQGDVVGYVIARPSDVHGAVRVIDIAVDPTHDTLTITAGLLGELVELPAHKSARFVEADTNAHQSVRRLLHIIESMPLAKCYRPDPCTSLGLVDGAAM